MILKKLNYGELHLLFLTETDVVIEDEEDYNIEGYKTIFPLRASKAEKLRIVALISNEISKNILLCKIITELVNFCQIGKTVTEMVPGCLSMIKSIIFACR